MQDNKLDENKPLDPTRYTITISVDPIQKLKEITEQEIIKLNNEKRQMETLHSNLDLLLKRYDLEKSYLGQIAMWYGAKPWWVKILLFIMTAGIAAGIGLLCHIPITLVLVTSGLYIFFAFFFINHYTIHNKQTKRLCEDIIELEKSLTVTINHFNELSKSLNKILINSHELNMQMLSDMQILQENVNVLTAQLKKYKSILFDLEQSKQSIIGTTTRVQQNLINGDKQYKECCDIIDNQASQISSICIGLDSSHKAFQLDSKSIQTIVDQHKKATDKIEILLTQIEDRNTRKSDQVSSLRRVEDPQTEETAPTYIDVSTQKLLEESKKTRLKTHEALKRLNANWQPHRDSIELTKNS